MRPMLLATICFGFFFVPIANAQPTPPPEEGSRADTPAWVPGLAQESVSVRDGLVEFSSYAILDGEAAATLALEMDAQGNRDGVASDGEVIAWWRAREMTKAMGPGCFDAFRFVTLDGAAPTSIDHFWLVVRPFGGMYGYNLYLTLGFDDRSTGPRDVEIVMADRGSLEAVYACLGGTARILRLDEKPRTLGIHAGNVDPASTHPEGFRERFTAGKWVSEAPAWVQAFSKKKIGTYSFKTSEEVDGAYATTIRFHVREQDPTFDPWIALLIVGALGGLSFTITEFGRFKLIGLPLFSRINRAAALAHPRRDDLLAFVRASPGTSFGDARRRLSIGHGAGIHHVRVLMREGFIQAKRDGLRVRLYPVGSVPVDAPLHPVQDQLLGLVRMNPGLRPTELAARLGLRRENVKYHLHVLLERGFMEARRSGRAQRYYAKA